MSAESIRQAGSEAVDQGEAAPGPEVESPSSDGSEATPSHPPAGWYPDNRDPTKQRWWNGTAWTNQVHPQSPGFCGSCGAALKEDQRFCAECGRAVAATPRNAPQPVQVRSQATQPKSVGLALFLNFIWPGAGHLYAGVRTDFGIIFAVIGGCLFLITLASYGFGLILTFPAWAVMAAWSMIDVNKLLKEQ